MKMVAKFFVYSSYCMYRLNIQTKIDLKMNSSITEQLQKENKEKFKNLSNYRKVCKA